MTSHSVDRSTPAEQETNATERHLETHTPPAAQNRVAFLLGILRSTSLATVGSVFAHRRCCSADFSAKMEEGPTPSASLPELSCTAALCELLPSTPQTVRVVVVGCGGGYDVFLALPLYYDLLALRPDAKVCLANFSHTPTAVLRAKGEAVGDDVYAIHPPPSPHRRGNAKSRSRPMGEADPDCDAGFFPERRLARAIEHTVYALAYEGGTPSLRRRYEALLRRVGRPDILVLADGGCDSLMFGLERCMGTWIEDAMSLAVVADLAREGWVGRAALLVAGATVDFHDGIEPLRPRAQPGGASWGGRCVG